MVNNTPRRKTIKWSSNVKFNPGVELVGQIVSYEAVAVDSIIVYIFPKWGVQMTNPVKEAMIRAFGGRKVFIEVKVSYESTGRYCEYDDYGR